MTESPVEIPRYRIVGGGTPTREQLAALVVALTPVTVVEEPIAEPGDVARMSGWRRAALLEAVGSRTFSSASDLATHAAELT